MQISKKKNQKARIFTNENDKEEKKGPSTRKGKQDGDEKKNGHKKKKSLDENSHSMEQCLKIVVNLEDLEMKESNMALLTEHLDKHARGRMKNTLELMEENIPKISTHSK